MLEIVEESAGMKGPPKATLTRRAKSYSDFYDVAMSFLSKEARTGPRDVFEFNLSDPVAVSMTARYENMEDELLDESQEDYQ